MGLLEIRKFGDPVLREKTKKVIDFDKRLFNQIDEMWKTLVADKNGAAIAANQVGILKNIIVIKYRGEEFEFINPEIVSMIGEQYEEEGCLSLKKYVGKVERARIVKVKYQNRNKEFMEVEREGDLAICFRHEIDHLLGILYIDRMNEKYVVNEDSNVKLSVKDLLILTNKIN